MGSFSLRGAAVRVPGPPVSTYAPEAKRYYQIVELQGQCEAHANNFFFNSYKRHKYPLILLFSLTICFR